MDIVVSVVFAIMLEKKLTRQQKYHLTHPWTKFVCWARRRCKPGDSRWSKFYYDRGIRSCITAADTKILWERDNAKNLKRPSLDRIRSEWGYNKDNCRFIEFEDNVRMGRDARRTKISNKRKTVS